MDSQAERNFYLRAACSVELNQLSDTCWSCWVSRCKALFV